MPTLSTQGPYQMHGKSIFFLNDLDRPATPSDFPDYRDLMVVDSEQVDIGRIVDILVREEDRKPLMAIVMYGGFLDMGAKHVLVPFDTLYDPTPSKIRCRLTRYEVSNAPDFGTATERDISNYLDYWAPPDGPVIPSASLPRDHESASGRGPLLRISHANAWQIPEGITDLRGAEVQDRDGHTLGAIDDWFLNVRTQRPEIAVIRRGGLLGAFAHESLVPFDRLTAVDDRTFRTDLTTEQIEGAPQLKSEIYDYTPVWDYWERVSGQAAKQNSRDTSATGEAKVDERTSSTTH